MLYGIALQSLSFRNRKKSNITARLNNLFWLAEICKSNFGWLCKHYFYELGLKWDLFIGYSRILTADVYTENLL